MGPIDSCLEVLRLSRNQRKLKIGQLTGNHFQLRLYGVVTGNLSERLKAIGSVGVPNYFGVQRFGRSGSNLEKARRLARRDPGGSQRLHPRDGMAASAARSAGFNAVVAERLDNDRWLDVAVGDVVSLAGRGSHFLASEADISSVKSRIMVGELDTTAPMAGRISKTSSEQNAFETATLQTDPELFDWMTGIFRNEDRRAVRVLPKQLEAEVTENTLDLSFWLPKGSFATAVLNELELCGSHMHGLLHERGLSRLVETLGDLGINDVFVLDAFRRVPRHLFVDPAVSDSAYTDVTLPLGYQQTLSQPSVVARMLELLRGGRQLNRYLRSAQGQVFRRVCWRIWQSRYLQSSE